MANTKNAQEALADTLDEITKDYNDGSFLLQQMTTEMTSNVGFIELNENKMLVTIVVSKRSEWEDDVDEKLESELPYLRP